MSIPTPRPYTPKDWYWLASDGRVYSSKRQMIVTESDGGYIEFVRDHGPATVWPHDDAGDQTKAALQDVVTVYGLTVP